MVLDKWRNHDVILPKVMIKPGYELTLAEAEADHMPVSTQFDTRQNQFKIAVCYHTELINRFW